MNILIELRICCYPANSQESQLPNRTEQYVNGLNKFFEYLPILNGYNVNIFITDNTIPKNSNLPNEILNIIPSNVTVITCLNNNYGCYNKGAGDIEQWLYNKELISQYDWFIHFEPRQLLKSFNFIENFLKNPRNLFTINENVKHFNTGLFCIQVGELIKYINNSNLDNMVSRRISIEDDLYRYFINNNISFDILEKLDLIWFATNHVPLHY
tara:strand:+ start:11 stop:646 length:636 start_codon:yes stop_codon:yes gene_type:complete